MYIPKFLCILFASSLNIAYCQYLVVKGTVTDSVSHEPLAFATISFKGNAGTVTDIDGQFSLGNLPVHNFTLAVSHIGYKSKEIIVTKEMELPLHIALSPQPGQLENVVISTVDNPAHRIIKLAQNHKDKNDPEHLVSFRYNGYTVAALGMGNYIWTIKPADSIAAKRRSEKVEPRVEKDTAEQRYRAMMIQRFKNNYLFLSESYTERIFRYPKQSKETVLATKVSGMRSPAFAFTSSFFQPFGFYKDNIVMLDKAYVNPIASGSISMYRFRLQEVQPHISDTTFIISFEPRKNKNFNGLKGILYINSDQYAIENVVASAADERGLTMRFKLQQKYERIEGAWFPVQLNSSITQMAPKSDSVFMYWDSRSYMSNVKIGDYFAPKKFSDVSLQFLPDAGLKTEKEWESLRKDSLNEKEKATYETYSMLPPKALKVIESTSGLMEAMFLEAIPYGKIDIPFKYFLNGLNRYEKMRLGAGFQTNPKFSKWISLGGFAGYGVADKAWKYGGNARFNLDGRTAAHFQVSYSRDLSEPGSIPFFVTQSKVLSSQNLRTPYISRMDSVQQIEFKFGINIRPRIHFQAWLLNEEREPARYAYEFKPSGSSFRRFINTELGLGMRFTEGEAFTRLGRAKVRARPATTELLLQISRGINGWFGADLDYTKTAIRLTHRFIIKRLGQTTIQLEAGKIWGDVPYGYLLNTQAGKSKQALSFYIPNSFQTAGLYEFASDQSAALFIQHSFGNLLFKPRNVHVRPEPVLLHNMSYGSLRHRSSHQGAQFISPAKGLFESGLLVNNIYRKRLLFCYLGLGAGAFYRYGYYRLPGAIDNWSFKISLSVTF